MSLAEVSKRIPNYILARLGLGDAKTQRKTRAKRSSWAVGMTYLPEVGAQRRQRAPRNSFFCCVGQTIAFCRLSRLTRKPSPHVVEFVASNWAAPISV